MLIKFTSRKKLIYFNDNNVNSGRSQASVCTMNGQLVAVGGCDAWNCTNTVEIYCPDEDRWSMLPPMNTARRGAGTSIFQGQPFIVREICTKIDGRLDNNIWFGNIIMIQSSNELSHILSK